MLRGRLPAVERVIGVDPEAEFVYLRTEKSEILAYDLESGRADTVAPTAVRAALGPDGTLYAVDTARRVTSVAKRVRFAWPQPLGAIPAELFGAVNQRLVAVVRQDLTRIIAAGAGQAPTVREVALSGDVAASHWGDLLAVAGDSGITLVDPLGLRDPAFVRLEQHPRALAFSPSGHRIYVARRNLAGLGVVDRFEQRELDGIALPGEAATIRLDPFGRWLLARPAGGDSVWIVDLPLKRLAGTLPTTWQLDLPAVGPDGTVLLRQGDDVVAFRVDTTGATLHQEGRVAGGAADLWVVTRWRPRWGAPPATAGAAAAADAAGTGEILYVQVSVSRNIAWSTEMAQQLSRAGLAARVLTPTRPDEGYRVVLGPYGTRAEAEAIGRRLGRPYWIYQPEP
ncbi:MAG TPA: SPOR domain-containing protein [Gemmatimonadales bacterium]